MTKKISIKAKKTGETEADAWVKDRGGSAVIATEGEAMKRLTIDVPSSLHKRIKTFCAQNGLIMADEIRTLLEEKFPKA